MSCRKHRFMNEGTGVPGTYVPSGVIGFKACSARLGRSDYPCCGEQGRGIASPTDRSLVWFPSGRQQGNLADSWAAPVQCPSQGCSPKEDRMATPRGNYVTPAKGFEANEKPLLLFPQPRPPRFSLLSRRLPPVFFALCLNTLLYFPQPCSSAPLLPPPLFLVSTTALGCFGQVADPRCTVVAAGPCAREYTVKEGDYCDKISQTQGVST